jgi:sucrose-6F-phosphate phosphohydrolase
MDPSRVLIADLDGTLLGDDGALERFVAWFRDNRRDYRLVYATGRQWHSIRLLMAATALPVPDAAITAVGTEIRDGSGHHWPGWADTVRDFDADAIRRALHALGWLSLQSDENQTHLKASYDVVGLTASQEAAIHETLARAGLVGRIVYSAGLHLDVVPPDAGKGVAACFLIGSWSIPPDAVMAFGDTGNDADLFQHGFRGTVVGNALPELLDMVGQDVYRSALPFADGVLDGIRHWSGDGTGGAI